MENIFGDPYFGFCILGMIVFLILAAVFYAIILRGDKKTEVHNIPPQQSNQPSRFCTECGRSIPFDAQVCPYCTQKI